MASIYTKKRKNGTTYYIAQRYVNAEGKVSQHNIRCTNLREVQLLLDDVKAAEKEGRKYGESLPSRQKMQTIRKQLTVIQLVREYIEHHSKNRKWEASSRGNAESITRNYIQPYIGDALVSELRQAFRLCENEQLRLMMQLMCGNTLRTGELLGLTWGTVPRICS